VRAVVDAEWNSMCSIQEHCDNPGGDVAHLPL
jgi:hypothetical protein